MRTSTLLIALLIASLLISCGNATKSKPNKVYMPDMAYSRAYETYDDHSQLKSRGIHYSGLPVQGTFNRSLNYVFPIAKDSSGKLINYEASAIVENPLATLSKEELKEAERLYLVNCGICHGTKMDGNGPLYNDGNGPYPAKPANLSTDPIYIAMTAGKMFYSITYGKNMMGSYASQLTPMERWQVIYYIKTKQLGGTTQATLPLDSLPAK